MDYLTFSLKDGQFHIEGFLEAEKVISLKGPRSRRIEDLCLHLSDLEFASSDLEQLNKLPGDKWQHVRQALWRSAIVHYYKCFGSSESRGQLNANKILKKQPPVALEIHEHYKALRDKHLVHDANSYCTAHAGAIINRKGAPCKVAKVACTALLADTLGPGDFGNLSLLIKSAKEWVRAEIDKLCELVTDELEASDHSDLLARPVLQLTKPGEGGVKAARSRLI